MVYFIDYYTMWVEDYNSTDKIKEAEKKVTVWSAEFSENLNNFLNDVTENQNEIISTLKSQESKELKNRLENLLRSQLSEDKNKVNALKFKLAICEPKDIASIIAEYVWYKIWDFDVMLKVDGSNNGISIDSMGQADQKTEQADQDKIVRDQKTEQADQDKIVRDQKTEQADRHVENNEAEKAMRKAIEGRDRLVAKYQEQNLDAKTNQNSENFKAVKTQLENNWTLNQLRQNHDEQFINDYILVQTTLQELKSNPTNYEQSDISFFDKVVKNLDNACNIPDTNLSSFSPDNIAQTRTELFNEDIWNDSLRQVRESNIESHKEVYNEMFPEEVWEEDLITNYWNLLQWQIKQFLENYVNNTGGLKNKIEEIKKNDNPTEEDKKLLQIYNYMIAELDKNRRESEEQTKKLMEEMCIISQIKWMSMCIWQEEWKDFNLNKANEIINDNWVLTLKWHIDWVDFSVRHDTKNPDQRLKIKSKLWVNAEDKNTFEIWKDESYVDSPFILPRQDEIFKVISEVVKSNDISKSDDLSKYLEGLQNSIIWRMDEVYKDAELAHHYITNKVKWEKIVDNSLAMIQWIKPNMQDLTKSINQTSNPKLYSFMKMIKFNVENSTTEEKNKLNKCLSKIPEIVDAYKTTKWVQNFVELKYPLIIENYLKNQTWLENWNEDSKLWLVFDMLSYYNQNSNDTRTNKESNDWVSSKIVINDLYRDLFEFSNNGQSEVWTKRKNENQEKQDKQEAEDVLALNDESIWPPVEYW